MVMVITYKLKTDLSMNYCTVLLWFLLLSGSFWTKRHRSLSHSFKDLLVTLWCDLLYFDKIFDLSCIIWSKLFLEVFSLFFCFFVLVWWFRDAWLIWVLETYLKNRRWTKVMMTSVWNTQSIFLQLWWLLPTGSFMATTQQWTCNLENKVPGHSIKTHCTF